MFPPHAPDKTLILALESQLDAESLLQRELAWALAEDCGAHFERFVATYQHRIFAFAYNVLGREDAEEVAQDVFVRAYRALRSYDAERVRALSLRAWLYAIAVNLSRNKVRGKRIVPVAFERGDGTARNVADPWIDGPEDAVVRGETRARLRAAIGELQPSFRVPFVLRHVDGLGYAEIAAILQRPVGTIKANVHRAAQRLRTLLKEQGITAV